MQGVRGNGQTRGKVERTAQTLSELPERLEVCVCMVKEDYVPHALTLCLTQTQRWLGNTMWTKKIDINIGYSTRARQFSDLLTCCRYLLICMASVVQI